MPNPTSADKGPPIRINYQSPAYKPELVTGRYVRCYGRKPNYVFRVFETATCEQKGSFFGQPGMGHTLREYETEGAEIPIDVRSECIVSKTTTQWG